MSVGSLPVERPRFFRRRLSLLLTFRTYAFCASCASFPSCPRPSFSLMRCFRQSRF